MTILTKYKKVFDTLNIPLPPMVKWAEHKDENVMVCAFSGDIIYDEISLPLCGWKGIEYIAKFSKYNAVSVFGSYENSPGIPGICFVDVCRKDMNIENENIHEAIIEGLNHLAKEEI